MNTPPRFFAAPPPSSRRRVSLLLGAALVAAWLLGLVLIVRLHLPPVWAKADIGAVALLWAAHVAQAALHNRALDRSKSHAPSSARPREGGDPHPVARTSRSLAGGRSPPSRG